VVDLLVEARIFSSKSRAREGIQSGAVYINGERLKYGQRILHLEDRLQGEYLIIRRGKRNYYLIQWV
jgi:tyrosyl-tRNA synthetase